MTTFGERVPDHQDCRAMQEALEKLQPRQRELDAASLEAIKNKHEVFRRTCLPGK